MKIIIAGDNLTAYSITSSLAQEQHDITLIGSDKSRLKHIEEVLDIQTVQGPYTEIETLDAAECDHADILIAATEIPETDILISLLASNLYQVPLTIAMLQESLYEQRHHLLKDSALTTSHIWINPSELVANSIIDLIQHPNCKDIFTIQNDYRILRLTWKNGQEAELDTEKLRKKLPDDSQIITVIRQKSPITNIDNTTLKTGDQLIIGCPKSSTEHVLNHFSTPMPIKSIMLAGISEISQQLAKRLPSSTHVKIIDNNLDKATTFARESDNITVLHGDINDTDLLVTEKIDRTDAFLALSNDDEDNLVAALQAKRHQVPFIASLVHRSEIAPIINENHIHSIEPQKMLSNFIFQIIHRDIVNEKHAFHEDMGEIICITIPKHFDGHTLAKIAVPHGGRFFYAKRANDRMDPHPKLKLKQGDILALYLAQARDVAAVTEQLNRPSPSFFDLLR
jgi:trk system potassium uptake protein TrkA